MVAWRDGLSAANTYFKTRDLIHLCKERLVHLVKPFLQLQGLAVFSKSGTFWDEVSSSRPLLTRSHPRLPR